MGVPGSPTKRKSASPFKSLKNTILRNRNQHPQLIPEEAEIESSRHKRQSIQRITLFRHDYVKVRSWQSDTPGTVNVISNKSSFEIYEIYMLNSKQRMNYLSLGRKDQFVHPILPKLKIRRKTDNGRQNFTIIISLFNPERFWEVTFLSNGILGEKVIKDFEETISKICQYEYIDNTDKPEVIKMEKHAGVVQPLIEDTQKEEDVDDLEYLLSNDMAEEPEQEDAISEVASTGLNESSTLSTHSIEHVLVQPGDVINKTFKQALERIRPLNLDSRTTNLRYKRFSSFQTTFLDTVDATSLNDTYSYKGKRRSISVPMELNAIKGHFGVDFNRMSWMDVTFEDISEI